LPEKHRRKQTGIAPPKEILFEQCKANAQWVS
jgi:hypothetical protein